MYWWQDLCRPYMGSETVYRCPSAFPHGQTNWINTSGPFVNNWNNQSRALSEIQDPAGTIATFDGNTNVVELWRLEQVDAWFNAGFGSAYFKDAPDTLTP